MIGTDLITILFLLIISGVFSLIETSFLSVSAYSSDAFVKQKLLGSKSLFRLKQNPRKTLITLMFGNTIVNFSAVIFASEMFIRYFPAKGAIISTIVMTIIVLLFGQMLPKIVAEQYATKIMLFLAKPTEVLVFVLTPITYWFYLVSKRIPDNEQKTELTLEELEAILRTSQKQGVVSKKSVELIKKIIDTQFQPVKNVMIPLQQVTILNAKKTIGSVSKIIIKEKHTEYPLLTQDNKVSGIVRTIDVLEALKKKKARKKLTAIAQDAFVVPDNKNVENLLVEMRDKNMNTAIVVDEFGTTLGIATVDDIVRQMTQTAQIKNSEISYDEHIIDAITPIDEVNKTFNTNLFSENKKTIGGIIEERLERIPKKGETLILGSLDVEIVSATKNTIGKVSVKKR